jgi:hypothetical protein
MVRQRRRRQSEKVRKVAERKRAGFEWTAAREEAARLVAEGVKTFDEIAAAIGVTVKTVWRWRNKATFAARVAEITNTLAARALRYDIAKVDERVRHLDRYWKKMVRVVEQRAHDPELAKAPGGDTGLLVRTLKSVCTGKKAKVVEEFTTDIALVREMREHLKHAAQELGQWQEDRPDAAVVHPIQFVEVKRGPEAPVVIDGRPIRPAPGPEPTAGGDVRTVDAAAFDSDDGAG